MKDKEKKETLKEKKDEQSTTQSRYEYNRSRVYSSGNRWAIENFNTLNR